MEFNIHDRLTAGELREKLGWWSHSGAPDTEELVSAIMILCDRVAALEAELAQTKRAANQAAYEANCLANGALPD